MESPIVSLSGFRSYQLNKLLKGSVSSDHMNFQADDFWCEDMPKAFHYARNNLEFDQLIWEKGNNQSPEWIHISYRMFGNRNEVLKYDDGKYTPFIEWNPK